MASERKPKRDELVRVLIGYVGKFDPTFSGKTKFSDRETQLSDEGPIISVLRHIQPRYACLMYGSKHAQAGAAATEDKYYAVSSYLRSCLNTNAQTEAQKVQAPKVFGYPIAIDNPTDYRCLEPAIPDTLARIQDDMQQEEAKSNLEYHVVWSGTREIRDVLISCVTSRVIDAQVWYTKEPAALRPGESRVQAKDTIMYLAAGRARVLQEAFQDFDLVIFRGRDQSTIEVMIKGRRFTDPDQGGIADRGHAVSLLYELCTVLSDPVNLMTGIKQCKPALLKERLPKLGNDIHKYRLIINKRYREFSNGNEDLIQTTGKGKNSEWSLVIPPNKILVA